MASIEQRRSCATPEDARTGQASTWHSGAWVLFVPEAVAPCSALDWDCEAGCQQGWSRVKLVAWTAFTCTGWQRWQIFKTIAGCCMFVLFSVTLGRTDVNPEVMGTFSRLWLHGACALRSLRWHLQARTQVPRRLSSLSGLRDVDWILAGSAICCLVVVVSIACCTPAWVGCCCRRRRDRTVDVETVVVESPGSASAEAPSGHKGLEAAPAWGGGANLRDIPKADGLHGVLPEAFSPSTHGFHSRTSLSSSAQSRSHASEDSDDSEFVRPNRQQSGQQPMDARVQDVRRQSSFERSARGIAALMSELNGVGAKIIGLSVDLPRRSSSVSDLPVAPNDMAAEAKNMPEPDEFSYVKPMDAGFERELAALQGTWQRVHFHDRPCQPWLNGFAVMGRRIIYCDGSETFLEARMDDGSMCFNGGILTMRLDGLCIRIDNGGRNDFFRRVTSPPPGPLGVGQAHF